LYISHTPWSPLFLEVEKPPPAAPPFQKTTMTHHQLISGNLCYWTW